MLTGFDKAIVSLVMAVLFMLNQFFGISIGLDQQTVSVVIAALMPLAVYFIPNRGPSDKAMEAAVQIDKQIPASAAVVIKTATGKPDIHIPGKP